MKNISSNIPQNANDNQKTNSNHQNIQNLLKRNLSSTSTNLSNKNSAQVSYHFHRNNKSLKILSLHLKQYKEKIDKQEIKTRNKLNNKLQNNKLQNFNRNYGQQRQSQQLSNSVIGDQNFYGKCQALIDNLLLNISIFKKVFASSKRKRTVISKLYGWDPIFNPIFFTKYGQNYSQQFRTNITKQTIISQLSLQKKSFTSQNIYNKLRLFLAQLISSNMNHQQLSSQQKRQKLIQSCSKLRKSLQKINEDIENGNIGIKAKRSMLKQMTIVKQTHIDMANMKVRIKNKAGDIQKIARNTGIVKVDPFYLKQQKNVQFIEEFVRNVISK